MHRRIIVALAASAFLTRAAYAQHLHTDAMTHPAAPAAGVVLPTLPGQAAYGAIAEIATLLQADSTTNWARVDLEAVRQHLIDMDEVTLRSSVVQQPVDRGARLEVTGTGRTRDAIRRMLAAHAQALSALPDYQAAYEPTPGGARLTVRARTGEPAVVQRIRGLGFIGLLTVGAHHAAHHLALARGEPMSHAN